MSALSPDDVQTWALRITECWQSSVEGIIRTGRLLIDAKTQLSHGHFGDMCKTDLPFGERTAQRLMSVAADRRLSNPTTLSLLPASPSVLYALTQFTDPELQLAIETKFLRPDMTHKEINTVVREKRRANVNALHAAISINSAPLPLDRKYPVICADPATRFKAGFGDRSIENHYPTETIEEWCKLPVRELAMPHCRLFVWTTVPQLAATITQLLPAWDFEYKSCCCWDKTSPEHDREAGTGYWFRNQHELLLLATRGDPALPPPAAVPVSMYRERKGAHSAKPDFYREMIEAMTPGLPRIELFARTARAGWTVWGNQAQTEETA
jgi:N6-adenosine-specific RNA methylase IME4